MLQAEMAHDGLTRLLQLTAHVDGLAAISQYTLDRDGAMLAATAQGATNF